MGAVERFRVGLRGTCVGLVAVASLSGLLETACRQSSQGSGPAPPGASPVATIAPGTPTSALQGTIAHGESGERLAGATVTALNRGARTARTDAGGAYRLGHLAAGDVTVSVSKPGFHPGFALVKLKPEHVTQFSAVLVPAVTEAKRGGLTGRIVDSSGTQPIPGAVVLWSAREGSRSALTDASGTFTIAGIAVGEGRLELFASGYEGGFLGATAAAETMRDVGTVVMMPARAAPDGRPSELRAAELLSYPDPGQQPASQPAAWHSVASPVAEVREKPLGRLAPKAWLPFGTPLQASTEEAGFTRIRTTDPLVEGWVASSDLRRGRITDEEILEALSDPHVPPTELVVWRERYLRRHAWDKDAWERLREAHRVSGDARRADWAAQVLAGTAPFYVAGCDANQQAVLLGVSSPVGFVPLVNGSATTSETSRRALEDLRRDVASAIWFHIDLQYGSHRLLAHEFAQPTVVPAAAADAPAPAPAAELWLGRCSSHGLFTTAPPELLVAEPVAWATALARLRAVEQALAEGGSEREFESLALARIDGVPPVEQAIVKTLSAGDDGLERWTRLVLFDAAGSVLAKEPLGNGNLREGGWLRSLFRPESRLGVFPWHYDGSSGVKVVSLAAAGPPSIHSLLLSTEDSD